MAKALKIFVILLFVLSIAALVLGIMLFGKREVLKAGKLKSDTGVAQIAKNLRFESFNPADLVVTDPAGFPALERQLGSIAAAADNVYNEMTAAKEDLARTQQDLAQTKDELATTRSDLDRTRSQVETLNQTVTAKNAEIARQEDSIRKVEDENSALQGQIEDLNNQIATLEDETQDLKDKVVTLENTINDMDAAQGITTRPLPRNLTGNIVVVNKAWNFVVLDIGSEQGLVPNAELLVHRGDKFVGKILISGVTRKLAVADINSAWMQTAIREGDNVAVQ